MNATARQLDGFIAKYAPEIAASIRANREALHCLFLQGFELIYDNYNALVFAFGPSERSSEAVVSLAAYPRWVTLFFANGASLSDPLGVLVGRGSRVRGVRLAGAVDISDPAVLALIAQAIAPVEKDFAAAPKLKSILKSVSSKQRPRQPNRSS